MKCEICGKDCKNAQSLSNHIGAKHKDWNKEADAAKKASEVAADAKKTYDDLKTSLDDVKSSLDDLHAAEDNLDGLTKGLDLKQMIILLDIELFLRYY